MSKTISGERAYMDKKSARVRKIIRKISKNC